MKKILLFSSLVICSLIKGQTNYVVTNNLDNGAGSLRDVIATATASPVSIISFSLNPVDTIKLLTPLSINSQTLTINGNGQQIVLSGNYITQIMSVTKSSVRLNNLVFCNGNLNAPDLSGGAALFLDSSFCEVTNCSFINNITYGQFCLGGVLNAFSSQFAIYNSTFYHNQINSDYFGGSCVGVVSNPISSPINNVITNCTFYNNIGEGIIGTSPYSLFCGGCLYPDTYFKNNVFEKATSNFHFNNGNAMHVYSSGHNIYDSTDSSNVLNSSAGDLLSLSPKLDTIAGLGHWQGSFTSCMKLLSNSPAISFGITDTSAAINYDQTGIMRSGHIDAGSVQYTEPGAALNFDGVDDYVDCANILGASYTKEAWIYITNLGLMNNIISGDDNLGTHAFWAPSANSNMLSAGHNGNWFAVEDNTPLLANTWYHVAVTYDSASQTMNLYKNGILVSTNTNVANFSNGSQTYIGSYNQAQNSFGGNIDEVRIWNRALCQGEIMNNMNGGLTLPQNGLVAYYKFNQGIDGVNNATVTTAADSSGNSNNGTLTNFALTGTTSNWVAPGAITAGNYASAFVNPTITISGDSVICSGTSTTLTVNGNVNTYTWSTSDNTASAVVAPTTDASYSVTASNNGCVSNTAVTTITVNALPVINSQSGSVHICGDTTGIFNVASNDITDTYQWNWFNVSTPNSLSALSGTYGDVGYATNNLSIHQLLTNGWGPSGEYGVNCVITNTANCSITSQPDTIFVNDLPTITASVTTPTLCLGSIDTLIAAGATMYMWSANAGSVMNDSAFVSPTVDDTYTVTGTDVNGCTNTATIQITVTSCSSGIKQIANRNISIYPNPTSGSFTIQSDKELGKITVYDMLNREVYTINANQTKATINIENLVSGVYYVNIAGSTIKVVKQ